MQKLRIIHCADVHLGAKFGAVPDISETLQQEQFEIFEKIISIARARADILLIAGDLFDTASPSPHIVKKTAELLESAAVPVFIAPGNHDCVTHAGVYEQNVFSQNVRVFKNEQLEYCELPKLGARVCGAGFCDTACRETEGLLNFAPHPRYADILILHTDLDGGEHSPYNPVDTAQLLSCGFDYAALGHVHTRYVHGNIAYSGCPMGTGFDETGEKGCLYAEVQKGEKTKIDFIPLGAREFICEQLNGNLPEKGNFKRDIYRLIVGNDADLPKLCALCAEKLFHYQITEGKFVMPDINSLMHEQGLRGEFVRRVIAAKESGRCDNATCNAALRYGLEAFEQEVSLL